MSLRVRPEEINSESKCRIQSSPRVINGLALEKPGRAAGRCYLLLIPASAFAFQLAPSVHRFTMLKDWNL